MKLRIPASSANLGPGFDSFGIAWQLYNEIEFEPSERVEISGCPEEFQNEDNLCYRAYADTLRYCGRKPGGIRISFGKSDIPISRGLGSSAALIAGGVYAADRLNSLGLSKAELLAVATEIEGHPDNLAPALYGGFTVSAMDGGRILTAPCSLSGKLYFTALIPDFRLSTELSRSVLPKSYSRSDAVFNISRAALLIKALEKGDTELLYPALQDKIHQSYRFPLIKGYEHVKAAAERLGDAALCISGAGPTLLCISDREGTAERLQAEISPLFPGWRIIPLLPDREGAKII